MNWKKEVKDWIKLKITPTAESGLFDLNRFDYWNNQNSELRAQKESTPRLSVYVEFSFVGNEQQFPRQTNLDAASFIPVEISLHIVLNHFGQLEDANDTLFDYAAAINALLNSQNAPIFAKRLELKGEHTDTTHDAQLEHVLTYRAIVINKVLATSEITDRNGNIIAKKGDTYGTINTANTSVISSIGNV